MLNSCPLLSFCTAPLTIPLQGLWVHSLQSSTIVPFHCMHILFFFNSSSSVKLLSSNPFPFSRFLQELLVPTLHNKQVSIPGFPHCRPHFHSMLDLLLGDAERELRCAHLSRGSACVCVHTDVVCTRLLFSESLRPLWAAASCSVI